MHCIHPFFSGLPSDQRDRCGFLLPCCQKCSQHKTNIFCFLDPLWGPKRGSRKWTPKWVQKLGGGGNISNKEAPFWGRLSGPHFGAQFLDPILGSTFWVPFSVPKMNTKNHKCLLYKSTCVANIFDGKEAENHLLVPI